MPSPKSLSASVSEMFKSTHTTCVLIGLIVVVLFLIYMSCGSSSPESCGCDSVEGIEYAKRVTSKPGEAFQRRREGLDSSLKANPSSTALKAMQRFGPVRREGLDVMRSRPVEKLYQTKTREGFWADHAESNKWQSGNVRSSSQSPFFGPISL